MPIFKIFSLLLSFLLVVFHDVQAATFDRALDLSPSARLSDSVPSTFFGANIGYWSEVSGPTLTAAAQEAGLTVFRYHPGTYNDPHTVQGAVNQWDFTAVDYYGAQRLADFGRFLIATGTTGQIHINYGAGSPAQAAALVAYLRVPTDASTEILNRSLGSAVVEPSLISPFTRTRDWRTVGFWANLRASAPLPVDDGFNKLRLNHPAPFPVQYFECGNEADYSFVPCLRYRLLGENSITQGATGFGGRRADAHTYANFYAAATALMKQVDPTIKVGASAGYFTQAANDTDSPAVPYLFPGPSGTTKAWTPVVLTRLRELGVTPDFIIAHRYTQQTDFEWNNNYLLRGALNAYLAPGQGSQPRIHVTELNWSDNESVPYSTTVNNAVNLARSFADALQNDVANLCWFTFTSGSSQYNSASTTGWRKYHNWGLIADAPQTGQTPSPTSLTWPGMFAGVKFPTFHAFALLKEFSRPGDVIYRASALSPLNTNSHDLTVFAALRASGDYTFLILNKADTTHALNLTLQTTDLTGHETTLTGSRYGKTQDEEQRLKSLQIPPVLSNNTRENFTLSRSGSALTYTAPPLSVTVLTLPALLAEQPIISSAEGAIGVIDQPFTHALIASGNGVTFTASHLPDGITFDAPNAQLLGTPRAAGDFSITITANNAQGSDTQTFRLSVRDRILTTLYQQNFSASHAWWSYQGDAGVSGALSTNASALQHAVTVTTPTASYWYAGMGTSLPTPPGLALNNLGDYTIKLRLWSGLNANSPIDIILKSGNNQTLTHRVTIPGQTWTEVEFPLNEATNAGFNPAVSNIEFIVSPSSSLWPLQSTSYRIDDVQITHSVPQDTPAQAWRRLHFSTILPLGNAAENADFDLDGANNLLEYALGTVPTSSSSTPQISSEIKNDKLQLSFTPATTTGLRFYIEASPNLSLWGKTEITHLLFSGQPYTHVHSSPVANDDRHFLRLLITH